MLTKALEKGPDAIECLVSLVPWAVGVINQSRELGFKGPICTSCGMGDINLVNGMLNPEYAYDIFHYLPDVLSDKMKAPVKELRPLVEAKTGEAMSMDNVNPLDALWPLMQAIEQAGSIDVEKVVDALENMKTVETVYGDGEMKGEDVFGINHVIVRPYTFSRIVNGKVEFEFVDYKEYGIQLI